MFTIVPVLIINYLLIINVFNIDWPTKVHNRKFAITKTFFNKFKLNFNFV